VIFAEFLVEPQLKPLPVY